VRLAIVLACVGCKADLPQLTDAHSLLDGRCTGPYADLLVDTFPTTLPNASAVLGAPDGSALSLVPNNVVTVALIGIGGISDAPGADVRIVATINGSALVRVAQSEMDFRYAGEINASVPTIDIAVADISSAVYVRIIGVIGSLAIDAIEATHDRCDQ
jgi:hypothetical protein